MEEQLQRLGYRGHSAAALFDNASPLPRLRVGRRAKLEVMQGLFALSLLICLFAIPLQADEISEAKGTEGSLWGWGENHVGQCGHQLGVGQVFSGEIRWLGASGGYLPRHVPAIRKATAVAAGSFHSLALDKDGSVWTWGDNDFGQLGRGTTSWFLSPGRVSNLNEVRAIAGGGHFSVALVNDGTVRAWGYNGGGQLGDGTTEDRLSPVQVLGLAEVKAVAAGGTFAIALKEDGTVWGWGDNSYGQLGDGTKENRLIPVRMKVVDHVKSIYCGSGRTMVLKEDGTVWGCGYNWYGDLGDGTETSNTEFRRTSPVQVKGLDEVAAIACGPHHTLALKKDGTVWAWGYGYHGQLGMGEAFPGSLNGGKRSTAAKVPGLQNIRAVAAGWSHSLAVDNDGVLWASGWNWGCQFGIAEPAQSLDFVKVGSLPDIEQVACGAFHTVAIRPSIVEDAVMDVALLYALIRISVAWREEFVIANAARVFYTGVCRIAGKSPCCKGWREGF